MKAGGSMKTVEVKISELEGAALDWAVAHAVEAWKYAHELFPTWTLDATFSGVQPMIYSDGQAFCQLIPNNPMRQDPQRYSPSTDWGHGGPLVDKHIENICRCGKSWYAIPVDELGIGPIELEGPTPLIAAMRAIVAAHTDGDTAEVPEELVEA